MTSRSIHLILFSILVSFLCVIGVLAQTNQGVPSGIPNASIDISTREGVNLVKGQWRYSDVEIIQVDFKAPGPDGQPTGKPVKTYDYKPHAGGVDFDDSKWEVLDPTSLNKRRSTGRICFNWYRINTAIPKRIGNFDPTGSTVVFETSLDDYAEIWVDGEISNTTVEPVGSKLLIRRYCYVDSIPIE